MRTFIIKNDSGVEKTYIGKVLQDQESYELEKHSELEALRDDEQYIADLSSQDAILNNGVEDIAVVSDAMNYLFKDDLNPVEIDDDKRQIVRSATTYKGWRYLAHPIEVETSNLTGVYSKDWAGNSRGDYSIKFYDNTDTELVAGTQIELDSNCVKTVVTFEPTYDYDIIGGNIHQQTSPADDIRLWVIAGATDVASLDPTAVKEFVGGLNIKFMGADEQIQTDGRASARLNYSKEGVPVPTNKVQYIFRHSVGIKHKIMIVLEYFRA